MTTRILQTIRFSTPGSFEIRHPSGLYARINPSYEHDDLPPFTVCVLDDRGVVYFFDYCASVKDAYDLALHHIRVQLSRAITNMLIAADEMLRQTRTTLQLPIGAHEAADETAALQDYADHMQTCANMAEHMVDISRSRKYSINEHSAYLRERRMYTLAAEVAIDIINGLVANKFTFNSLSQTALFDIRYGYSHS